MLNRDALRTSAHTTFVALFSYVCGSHFTYTFHKPSADMGGLWSVIAGIMVLQTTRHATTESAWRRAIGTLIGALTSAVYVSVLPFSALGLGACILVTVLFCHVARIGQHARIAALTVAVILVLSDSPTTASPVMSAALRFFESCIGAAIAVIALLVWPEPPAVPDPAPPGGVEQRR